MVLLCSGVYGKKGVHVFKADARGGGGCGQRAVLLCSGYLGTYRK